MSTELPFGVSADHYLRQRGDVHCSLIVHADGTVVGWTEERDGCRGRDERHDCGAVSCIKWFADGCNYCGVQNA